VGLCIPLSLLGNGSVAMFPRQRRIAGAVFYAVPVVSKVIRRFFPERLLFAPHLFLSPLPAILLFLSGVSPPANYTDRAGRRLSAKVVSLLYGIYLFMYFP
jgi:hypothetical protein